jgi:hypothetical protein
MVAEKSGGFSGEFCGSWDVLLWCQGRIQRLGDRKARFGGA